MPDELRGSRPCKEVRNKMSNSPDFANNLFLFMEETLYLNRKQSQAFAAPTITKNPTTVSNATMMESQKL